mgnify:CR=1 FL=1
MLDRQFAPNAPNRVWTGDITYIATAEGWLYLAVVIDLFNREVIGWSIKSRMTTDLVLDALSMACLRRRPEPGVLFHTDQIRHARIHVAQGQLLGHSVQNTPRTSDRSDPCWDWPSCPCVDLSIGLRRSPSIAGPNVCDLIGALFCTVSVNAPTESFFNSLENERVHGTSYATRNEATSDLFQYIAVFYNRSRRHSALGYLSPATFLQNWIERQDHQEMAA